MPLHYGWLPVGPEEVRFVEGGEGAPVVFLHGALGSLEMTRPAAEILSRDFHVFSFDLPGFGSSRKNDVSYTISYFADFLHNLLERRKFSRPTLIGTSLGARIALEFCLKYPTEMNKLVLVSPARILDSAVDLRGILALVFLREFFMKFYLSPSRVKRMMEKQYHGAHARLKEYWKTNPALQDQTEHRLWIRALTRAVRSLFLSPAGNRIGEAARPTLIVSGTDDTDSPVTESEQLHAAIPGSHLEIVKHAGHFLMLERPEEFARIVSNFILLETKVGEL